MTEENEGQHVRINCRGCRYFHVTWDSQFPYGCRAYGFKGPLMPYMMVWQSTGQHCIAYEKRPQRQMAEDA